MVVLYCDLSSCFLMITFVFFFFQQKSAFEMRIIDWSSDVCSSDLPVLTTMFHDSHAFELGGRRFELYSVKGGETVDSLAVWLPRERIVFTGNMTGPIFGHVPNLYTVRGERYRYVQWYLDSVQQVIDQIGRAHVCTPVTTAHLVCRLLLEQK